jgi:hydrogenase 3 maturation protease
MVQKTIGETSKYRFRRRLHKGALTGNFFYYKTTYFLSFMSASPEKELKDWFKDAEKVVLAGIGNPIRTDDYVGQKIVEDLKDKLSEKICLIECETVPESYVSDIKEFQPTHVLLINAGLLNLKPGQFRLVQSEELSGFVAVTSHVLPLRIFCDLVVQLTGAKIALLLIEPENMEFGEGLTCEVAATAKKLEALLVSLFGTKK